MAKPQVVGPAPNVNEQISLRDGAQEDRREEMDLSPRPDMLRARA